MSWRGRELGVAFAAAIAAAGLAELVLRLDAVELHPRFGTWLRVSELAETGFFELTGDPQLPYVLRPETSRELWWGATVHTNSRGGLGDELTDAAQLNLLFLGDSVTFGLGVQPEETFPERLRGVFPRARIGVLAAPGYDTNHELALLRRALDDWRWAPDVIVLQFGENDYLHPSRLTTGERHGFYVKRTTRAFVAPAGAYRRALDHSELFFRLHDLATRWLDGVVELVDHPDRHAELERLLGELRDLARERGIAVVFLNLPTRDAAALPERRRQQIDALQRGFTHAADLRLELPGRPALWFDRIHPSAAGHALIAQRLRQVLEDHRLL
jgi:lysophospholipase L1-like esterase